MYKLVNLLKMSRDSYKYLGVLFDNKLKWTDLALYKNKLTKLITYFYQFIECLTLKEITSSVSCICTIFIGGWNNCLGRCFITALGPFLTTQQSIFKVSLKKNAQYTSGEHSREMDVLDLGQLFVKNLTVFVYTNSDSIFNPVTQHTHNTRFSTAVGIITPRIKKSTYTNTYFLAHILYKNIPNKPKGFHTFKRPTYKQRFLK